MQRGSCWSCAQCHRLFNTLAGRRQQRRAQLKRLIRQDGAQSSQHLQVSCWCMTMSLRRTCWGMMQHVAPATVGLQLTRVACFAGRPL